MSTEEKDNKKASDSSEGFGAGFKGFKDFIAGCCGTEGKGPDCRTIFEGFKNSCCATEGKEASAGKDESKRGCC